MVEKFVEKPSLELAKEYLSSGKYLWNSGMFVWKVSSIVENFRQHFIHFQIADDALAQVEPLGIDYSGFRHR